MPRPQKPAPPPPPDSIPHPITFFVSAKDRARILRALRRHHPKRTVALLIALNLKKPKQ